MKLRFAQHNSGGLFTGVAALALMALAACASANEGHDHSKDAAAVGGAAAAAESTAEFSGDAYPLDHCVVTGDKLDAMGGAVTLVHEGRHIQFCCDTCVVEFKDDPAQWLKKIDDEIVAQQQDRYPLETCMVSGEKLGSMGDPINLVVGNRLVKICCAGCEKTVRADPAKFIDQLNKAAADAQRASYPLETCPVSGEKLGSQGKIKEIVFAGRLVLLCCPSCAKQFRDNPHHYLQKLDGDDRATSGTNEKSSDESAHDGHGDHQH